MVNTNIFGREQLIRKVTSVGNGAHVFAPREWLGDEVLIVREARQSVKEKILNAAGDYLEQIIGIYLYGSQARGEHKEGSDIDVLVISKDKLKIRKKGFEIISLRKEDIKHAIVIAPVLIYSALAEAKPIINSELLDELRDKYKPKIKDFREYLSETMNMISINEEFLDTYSIILRLRGIYTVEMLLSGKEYSYAGFKIWIMGAGKGNLSEEDFEKAYSAYNKIKNNSNANVGEISLRQLLSILKDKTEKIWRKVNA